jgi:hypothetical protein
MLEKHKLFRFFFSVKEYVIIIMNELTRYIDIFGFNFFFFIPSLFWGIKSCFIIIIII